MTLWFISIALNEALLRLQVNPGNNCHSLPSLFQLTQYPQHFCSVFYRDLHFFVCDSLKFSIVFFFYFCEEFHWHFHGSNIESVCYFINPLTISVFSRKYKMSFATFCNVFELFYMCYIIFTLETAHFLV